MRIFNLLIIEALFISMVGCGNESFDNFEMRKTEELMKVPVTKLPLGSSATNALRFSDLPLAKILITERDVKPALIPASFEKQPIVEADTKNKEKYIAYCGRTSDETITQNPKFVSDIRNRRHLYSNHGGMAYYPFDIIVGKKGFCKISPDLVFWDVGSHSTHPHALSIDDSGNVHLIVCDVFIERDNRLKIYWAIGDPLSNKWEKIFLVEQNLNFTYSSMPRFGQTKNAVHSVIGTDYVENGKRKFRLSHLSWDKINGFNNSVILYEGSFVNFAVAGCRDTDSLVVFYSTKEGVYLLGNRNKTWSSAKILPEKITNQCPLSVSCVGTDLFRLQIDNEKSIIFDIRVLN